MTGGRPLRFLAMALGGWTMIRIAFVLSDGRALPVDGAIPAVIRILVPDAVATVLAQTEGRLRTVGTRIAAPIVAPILTPSLPFPARTRTSGIPERTDLRFLAPPPPPPPKWKRQIVPLPSPFAPPARVRDAKRLNGSAWLLVRGGPAGTVSGGQLGASQGGVRLTYALEDAAGSRWPRVLRRRYGAKAVKPRSASNGNPPRCRSA